MSVRLVNPSNLELLAARLVSSFSSGASGDHLWAEPEKSAKVLAQVRRRHDGPSSPPDSHTLAAAAARFIRTGAPEDWRSLKHVCFGVASPLDNGKSVLSIADLRQRLFGFAQNHDEPRRQLKCFQALLSAYFSFPLTKSSSEDAVDGWHDLRDWLSTRADALSRFPGRKPGWFTLLNEHLNVLGDNPCDRYGGLLLKGDGSELEAIRQGLGIPLDSWFQEEAVLAHIRAAVRLGHEQFKDALKDLLSVSSGKSGVTLSRSMQIKCVASLVSRYAKCSERPEHQGLRDAAVSIVGNPWLRRASWDASVLDDTGQPDDGARELVYGWLKRRLITDFFELLSSDAMGDRRRLDYWLRFEPFIEDMWFALGSDVMFRKGTEFDDFRSRAKGRLFYLDGTTVGNNAFIMRMGEYVAVEFGQRGHAFSLFRWDSLPRLVMSKLLAGQERMDINLQTLKATDEKKRHVDSPVALVSWEQKFDAFICPLLGRKPDRRPAFVPAFEAILSKFNLEAEDGRPNGYLWVKTDDRNTAVKRALGHLGFVYRSGRGWYKE